MTEAHTDCTLTAHRSLRLTTYCWLLTAHCSPLTTAYYLLTAHYCVLPTHRSLLTAHYSRRTSRPLLTAHLTPSAPATQAHSASYLAALAAAEEAGVIEDGGIVARPHTLGRGDAFGTAALLDEGGVHLEALVAVDTVRACVRTRMCTRT